jgi:hypothetical protein
MLTNNLFSDTIVTYSVKNINDIFNGTYSLTYLGQEKYYGTVVWSGNNPTNKNDLNFVIHGYLNPHAKYDSNLIPDGLFIGTTWFYNNKTPSGISVTNCIGTMYDKIYIVGIQIIPNGDKYDVQIVLKNVNKLHKIIVLFCIFCILLLLIYFHSSKHFIQYVSYVLLLYFVGVVLVT